MSTPSVAWLNQLAAYRRRGQDDRVSSATRRLKAHRCLLESGMSYGQLHSTLRPSSGCGQGGWHSLLGSGGPPTPKAFGAGCSLVATQGTWKPSFFPISFCSVRGGRFRLRIARPIFASACCYWPLCPAEPGMFAVRAVREGDIPPPKRARDRQAQKTDFTDRDRETLHAQLKRPPWAATAYTANWRST